MEIADPVLLSLFMRDNENATSPTPPSTGFSGTIICIWVCIKSKWINSQLNIYATHADRDRDRESVLNNSSDLNLYMIESCLLKYLIHIICCGFVDMFVEHLDFFLHNLTCRSLSGSTFEILEHHWNFLVISTIETTQNIHHYAWRTLNKIC